MIVASSVPESLEVTQLLMLDGLPKAIAMSFGRFDTLRLLGKRTVSPLSHFSKR